MKIIDDFKEKFTGGTGKINVPANKRKFAIAGAVLGIIILIAVIA
jgi:hypothetical protein